jgi:tyrosyl-DNA phosphodiesterase 1
VTKAAIPKPASPKVIRPTSPKPTTSHTAKRSPTPPKRIRSPEPPAAVVQPVAVDESTILAKKRELHGKLSTYFSVVMPMCQMADKLKKAAPFNFFLTSISDSKPTHSEPLTITFQELLDHSLGNLESSCQINFMIDIGWLLGNYYFAGYALVPLLVLYGDETAEIRDIQTKRKNVTSVKVQMPTPFSSSHSKIGLYAYKDGSMRVVVSTANLYEDDWQNRVQGIWVSPRLPELAHGSDTLAGESPTGFKADLLQYLVSYRISQLQPWIAKVRSCDFSEIK